MNIKDYFIGDVKEEIFLTVTVSTPGIAVSKATLILSSGLSEIKAESKDGTGLLPKTKLGQTSELNGSLIEVSIDILLNKIPKADWTNCFDNLEVKCYLEGGETKQQVVYVSETDDKNKSVSGKTISVKQYVQLSQVLST